MRISFGAVVLAILERYMKRDLEMVRDILLEIENLPYGQTLKVIDTIPEERRNYWRVLGLNSDEEELKCCDPVRFHHARLLWESGFVREPDIIASGRSRHEIIDELELYRLTTEGHDFLDSIRNETVWRRTKTKLAEVGGNAPLAIIKTAAHEIMKRVVMDGI